MEAWSVAAQKLIDQSRSTKLALTDQQRKELRKEAKHRAREDVFGVGFKTDRNGVPIEQGIGSPGNGSIHDAEAFKKYCGPSKDNPQGEPGWEDVYKAKLKNAHETAAKRAKQRQEEEDEE